MPAERQLEAEGAPIRELELNHRWPLVGEILLVLLLAGDAPVYVRRHGSVLISLARADAIKRASPASARSLRVAKDHVGTVFVLHAEGVGRT